MLQAWLGNYLGLVWLGAGILISFFVVRFLYDSRQAKPPDQDPLESFGPPLEMSDWPPKDW
jgi:hypothetical protein